MIKISTLIILTYITFPILAQNSDSVIFEKLCKKVSTKNNQERIVAFSNELIESPYVAKTLEINEKERLIVNLREFDCATFVESVMALAMTKDSKFETYKANLQKLRYRSGQIENYGTRLHYFSDWLISNERNHTIKNISQQIGGKAYIKAINFMSFNQKKYPKLENDYRSLEYIKQAEQNLERAKLYYIPKNEIKKVEAAIQDGDIIAITTSIKGLDVSHEGFAIKKSGILYFLHASQDLGKVTISEEPLVIYLSRHPSQTGIMVARIKN